MRAVPGAASLRPHTYREGVTRRCVDAENALKGGRNDENRAGSAPRQLEHGSQIGLSGSVAGLDSRVEAHGQIRILETG
jgi:hypothetical protein